MNRSQSSVPYLKDFAKQLIEKTGYRVLHKNHKELRQAAADRAALQKIEAEENAAPLLSLVVPTYNVDRYIERFLQSVFSQTADFDKFEVIIADDGSTDRSAEIAKAWQARYPRHIVYLHKENGGASSARNAGMALARGTWISFPDPDDFLDPDYFTHMLAEVRQNHKKPLLAVASNLIIYYEDRDAFSDTHPLKYRFADKPVRLPSDNLGNHMQLSVATCWIRRSQIVKHDIQFSDLVRPSFEDAHMLNSLLIQVPRHTVAFVGAARYYYRKRSDKSSQLDAAKADPSWYLDQIRYGYLDLLEKSAAAYGKAQPHIQRLCLYDLFWRFRYLVNHAERAAFLTTAQKQEFLELVQQVIDHIDVQTIERFNLAGCTEEHKAALLMLYKGLRRETTMLYLEQIDSQAGMAQFSYFTGGDDHFDLRILVNGVQVAPVWPSGTTNDFMGLSYNRRNLFWVPLRDGDQIAAMLDEQPLMIKRRGTRIGQEASWFELRQSMHIAPPKNLDAETLRLRNYVKAMRPQYHGGLVLMDRDDKADDNAEHLYRHLLATGRAEKAWFILKPESPDWPRLQDEGFKLLPFGSDDHIAAMLNADFLLSSHAATPAIWPVGRRGIEDLVRYKFVFLQHGVIMNDVFMGLNSKPIRHFVTTMPAEAAEIARPDSNYIFSQREVLHSGLPRHDALRAKAEGIKPDTILLVPTWRKYLTDTPESVSLGRSKIDNFRDSDFAVNWRAVLNSPRLRHMAEANQLRIVFALHANMAMYLDDFDLPSHVEAVDVLKGVSYQTLFAQARVSMTDYSSAVMDLAYIDRPTVYFQFDADRFFNGDHGLNEGFFSYERDGFGPVTATLEIALEHLEKALLGQENPIYAERRAKAFPFRDGKCCERVYQAIEGIMHK